MTIKVEQETIIALQTSNWLQHHSRSGHDECISRDSPKQQQLRVSASLSNQENCVSPLVDKLSLCRANCTSFTDDEDESVYTTSSSTGSFSSDVDSFDRKVSFADNIVTDVWERPYTDKEEIASLYYSNDETQRFRQEYRIERKLLSSLACDHPVPTANVDNISTMLSSTCSPSASFRHRNGISRVVVLHNDRLETFSSDPDQLSSTGISNNISLSRSLDFDNSVDDCNGNFFDTPEFWSGSITWW